jgi:NAD(P)-dependent dehydrogenase (short-subunit alcohol dehydrogenase family)
VKRAKAAAPPPSRYPEMRGKIALVTGGTSGIGLATVAGFLREGARVILASRDARRAAAALSSIAAPEDGATWIECDVSSGKAVEKLLATVRERHGRLDYAFNNGGSSGGSAPVAKMTEAAWRKTMDGYLTSVFLCLHHQIPLMLETGGVIVNNASVDGLRGYPFPGGAAYSAAKHGVLGLTRSAALEHAASKLRITAVCPGWVDTPAIARYKSNPELYAEILRQTPRGRIATADEIANGVLWLCSDAASFMLGSPLILDGGYMA